MRNLKRALLTVFILMLILAILAFVLENQQSVSLLFLGWVGPELPMSVIAVVAFLTGMLIGPCIGWVIGRISGVRQKRLV